MLACRGSCGLGPSSRWPPRTIALNVRDAAASAPPFMHCLVACCSLLVLIDPTNDADGGAEFDVLKSWSQFASNVKVPCAVASDNTNEQQPHNALHHVVAATENHPPQDASGTGH